MCLSASAFAVVFHGADGFGYFRVASACARTCARARPYLPAPRRRPDATATSRQRPSSIDQHPST
eukprot:6605030-Lingulodinium_polyedra.AAC.1